jgi:hypothetical protein
MKLKVIITLAATSLGAAVLLAQPESALGKKPTPAAGTGAAGVLPKTVGLPPPAGLKWGLRVDEVSKLYDRELEKQYHPLLVAARDDSKKASDIDMELKGKQGVLRRSKIDFADTPTGIDQSALKGEYSYGNGEALARILPPTDRKGKAKSTGRNFFFFNDKLWKIYDEHVLGPESKLGENYAQAIANLTDKFGVAGKKIPADYTKGQNFDETVWRNDEKVIRAVDRGETLGMVYVDAKVQDNLANYRKKKLVDEHALDKDVAAATANPPSQVTGPKEPEKDKKAGAKDSKKK